MSGCCHVPLGSFTWNVSGRNTLRLNFSNADPAHIEEGIARFGRVAMRQLERLGQCAELAEARS